VAQERSVVVFLVRPGRAHGFEQEKLSAWCLPGKKQGHHVLDSGGQTRVGSRLDNHIKGNVPETPQGTPWLARSGDPRPLMATVVSA
jgi:hypothetical protein